MKDNEKYSKEFYFDDSIEKDRLAIVKFKIDDPLIHSKWALCLVSRRYSNYVCFAYERDVIKVDENILKIVPFEHAIKKVPELKNDYFIKEYYTKEKKVKTSNVKFINNILSSHKIAIDMIFDPQSLEKYVDFIKKPDTKE